jgi:hypothetical protein
MEIITHFGYQNAKLLAYPNKKQSNNMVGISFYDNFIG